jgi:hypothetical protein
MATLTTEQANEILPQNPSKAPTDARRLKYLIIGPPKWGKTTLACSAPDSILLATEEGHLFHETHKIIIDSWATKNGPGQDEDGNTHLSMVEAVEALVAGDRFQMVVIDTADMAAKMCLDHYYKKMGVQHAQDAGDYGKGWDICLTQPFRQQIGQILHSGRGVMFITHTNLVTKKVGGVEQSRWETSLPSQVQKFLHTQADVILHGSFGKLRPGMRDRDRIVSLDGTNEVLAGSRIRGVRMPKKFVVDPEHPWEQWASFFTDPTAAEKAENEFLKLMGVSREKVEDKATAAETQHKTISEPVEESTVEKEVATPRKTFRRREKP